MNQISVYENKNKGGEFIVPLFDNKKLELLKNTICKGSTDDEFELFLHACRRTGLDPFMRQIYAVKRPERQKDGSYKEVITIQTAIDGYRLIAERTGKYSPGREPTYTYDSEGKIISCTAYVKKQTYDGTWHEIAATAFFNEYCQRTKEGKPTKFWMQLGHAMIAKCAEALALRKAFPGDLSGLYTKEEMQQADFEDVTNLEHKNNDAKVDLVQQISIPLTRVINKSEWKELNQLIDQCTVNANSFLRKQLETMKIYSDEDFEKMDEKTFIKMKNDCIRNIEKQKALKNEDNSD